MDNLQGSGDPIAAFIAGLWLADGHIGISKSGPQRKERYRVQIVLAMTDLEVIERAHEALRLRGIGGYISHVKGPYKRKDVHRLSIYAWGKVAKFLKLILPYLVGRKRNIAQVLLPVAESGRDRGYRITPKAHKQRDKAYLDCKMLNRKGR